MSSAPRSGAAEMFNAYFANFDILIVLFTAGVRRPPQRRTDTGPLAIASLAPRL